MTYLLVTMTLCIMVCMVTLTVIMAQLRNILNSQIQQAKALVTLMDGSALMIQLATGQEPVGCPSARENG